MHCLKTSGDFHQIVFFLQINEPSYVLFVCLGGYANLQKVKNVSPLILYNTRYVTLASIVDHILCRPYKSSVRYFYSVNIKLSGTFLYSERISWLDHLLVYPGYPDTGIDENLLSNSSNLLILIFKYRYLIHSIWSTVKGTIFSDDLYESSTGYYIETLCFFASWVP